VCIDERGDDAVAVHVAHLDVSPERTGRDDRAVADLELEGSARQIPRPHEAEGPRRPLVDGLAELWPVLEGRRTAACGGQAQRHEPCHCEETHETATRTRDDRISQESWKSRKEGRKRLEVL